MNILQFKNATQHFMATNRVFRFYKKWTDNSGWLTFGCISIGVAVMIMLGVHNIPHLPFAGEELEQALSAWWMIVIGKMLIGGMFTVMPLAFISMVLSSAVKHSLRKECLSELLPVFEETMEKASDDDKRAVMETALKLEGSAHYKDIEDLQKCAKEDLPKGWWMAVDTHLKIVLHNEMANNPHHAARTEEQNRFAAAYAQLSNRAHQAGPQTFKI